MKDLTPPPVVPTTTQITTTPPAPGFRDAVLKVLHDHGCIATVSEAQLADAINALHDKAVKEAEENAYHKGWTDAKKDSE